jgi:hypothetical protein
LACTYLSVHCGTPSAIEDDMRTFLLATSLTAALAAAAPAALAAPAEPAPITHVAPVKATTPSPTATDADAARYADAEKANPQAANFTGGATFVLIGSTTALILCLILLVLIV